MELTLQTSQFQTLVSKAIKGLGNSYLPVTSMIAIEVKNGTLSLITTDLTNYLKVTQSGVSGTDFYVCVSADQFSKLVSKLTTETLTLQVVNDQYLLIKAGTGSYKIEIPLDENEGGQIRPNMEEIQANEASVIKKTSVKLVTEVNKNAVAKVVTSENNACLLGYYCDVDQVITSNRNKIASSKVGLFSSPALLSAKAIDLLSAFESEDITVQRNGTKITFYSENMVLTTTELTGREFYPVDGLKRYLDYQFDSNCVISRKEFSSLIDRLSLFIDPNDQNLLALTFRNDGIYASTKKSNGAELVHYKNSVNQTDFTCYVDIVMLKSLVDGQTGDDLTAEYGKPEALKFVTPNSTQLISLAVDPGVAPVQNQTTSSVDESVTEEVVVEGEEVGV